MNKRKTLKECEILAKPAMRAALSDVALSEALRRSLGIDTTIEDDAFEFRLTIAGPRSEDSILIALVRVDRRSGEVKPQIYEDNIPLAEKRAAVPINRSLTIT